MPEISWIKLSTRIFDDERMKLISAMPEGDAIFIMWIWLITLAGKCNYNGKILLNENIPYTDEMLSTITSRPISIVRLALETFHRLGMVEIENGEVVLVNWGKHQSVDELERIRKLSRDSTKRYRDRLQIENKPCDVTVTAQCNHSDDADLDKDIDLDKKKSIMSGKPDATPPKSVKVAEETAKVEEVIAYLNKRAGTHFRAGTKAHAAHVKARLREGCEVDDFKRAIVWCVSEWKDDPKMEIYIRPDTIFNVKMPGYVENYYRKKRNLTEEDK